MQNTVNYMIRRELDGLKYSPGDFMSNRFKYANNLYYKDLKGHFSCVNAIEFSNKECNHLISAGDDRRILVWNMNEDILSNKQNPIEMKAQHNSNIFTLAWDNENGKIFSGANDHQVIVHDVQTRQVCDIFLHDNAVLSISVSPSQSSLFATACESGEILLYDLRLSNTNPVVLASTRLARSSSSSFITASSHDGGSFHACSFNPINSNLLAIGNEITGLGLIDIRMKSTLMRYLANGNQNETKKVSSMDYKQNVMSLQFNQTGTRLAALRFKLRPVIYDVNDASPKHLFDHEEFKNSCTLKSCCFAGDNDEYLVSGSDEFSIFVWKIPPDTEKNVVSDVHLRLRSHRSIVNQCRFNRKFHLLASSGIEKVIKIWSPYDIPKSSGGGLFGIASEYQPKRKLFKYSDLLEYRRSISIRNDVGMLPYASLHNEDTTEEDKMMIAFFDFQIQRKHQDLECDSDFLDYINESDSEAIEFDTDEANSSSSSSSSSSTTSSSSSSGSSSSSSSSSTNSELDEDFSSTENSSSECSGMFGFSSSESENSSTGQTKANLNTLRSRLMSLRHRQSLNLTEQSDFIDVLDSLKVNRDGNVTDTAATVTNDSHIPINTSIPTSSNIEILNASAQEEEEKEEVNDEEITQDTKTKSFSLNRIRSLNEQKRKIECELEEEDDDSFRNKRLELEDDDEQSDESNLSRKIFKRLGKSSAASYRKNNRKS